MSIQKRQSLSVKYINERKVNAMSKSSIWAKFGEDPQNPEDVSVIGIDNGAGELTANRADFRYGELCLDSLRVDNDNNRYTYAIYNDDGEGVIGRRCLKIQGKVFTNIKVPPEKAVENYGKTLKKGSPTYQYLMSKSFSCFIRDLLKNKAIIGDYAGKEKEVKHIYLFVGRPSSSVWDDQAVEYQKILKAYLSELEKKPWKVDSRKDMPEIWVKFHMLVYSEAEAAMANEYWNGNIEKNETVAVIDGGCSTFDFIIVRNGRVVNEYSRQVGAGMIEKNMFDIILLGRKNATLPVDIRKKEHDSRVGKTDRHETDYLVELRDKKEAYYGSNGDDGNSGDSYSIWYDDGRLKENIDKSFMDLAVKEIPVRVERSYFDENDSFGGNKVCDYPSFQMAIDAFCRGAKARCVDKKTNEKLKVDRIILTGGATVMPFVQGIVKEVFGVEENGIQFSRPSEERRYSVSRGLAYMGYVELKKYHESEKIRQAAHQEIEAIKWNIGDQVRTTCKEEIWEDFFVKKLNEWAGDPSKATLRDWYKMRYTLSLNAVTEDLKKLLAEKEVVGNLNDALKKHFEGLFPKAKGEYTFKIQERDIINAFKGKISGIKIYMGDLLGAKLKLTSFFGRFNFLSRKFRLKKIDLDTALTNEEKKQIQTHVRENKSGILKNIVPQISKNTEGAISEIYKTLIDNIDNTLDTYIEGLMPYFVEEAANVKNGRN